MCERCEFVNRLQELLSCASTESMLRVSQGEDALLDGGADEELADFLLGSTAEQHGTAMHVASMMLDDIYPDEMFG